METLAKHAARLGCLTSIVAPILALLLYPRANWLFALALIGVAVLFLQSRDVKDPTPQALADDMERILEGTSVGWEIDAFESLHIRDSQLEELWLKARRMGLPEEWVRLSAEEKDQLREIIHQLRTLGVPEDFLADRQDSPPQKRELF